MAYKGQNDNLETKEEIEFGILGFPVSKEIASVNSEGRSQRFLLMLPVLDVDYFFKIKYY